MHKQIAINISPIVFKDVVINELSQLGFDSFWETETGINAYIEATVFDKLVFEIKLKELQNLCTLEVTGLEDMPEKNWNEEWEKQFDPVMIANDLVIKAPFHEVEGEHKHTLLIQPKMSFGTGHHATTYLVAQQMLSMDLSGQKVLDFGSGTAILSILAEMLGSTDILAIDNDEWSYDNAKENTELNNCQHIDIKLGSSEYFEGQQFNVIIANINRAVILSSMQKMKDALLPNGKILISGILRQDQELVIVKATECGLQLLSKQERNNWMMLEVGS